MKGKEFKKLLKINDLTQGKAGKLLNVSRQTVNGWCKLDELDEDALQKVKSVFQVGDISNSIVVGSNVNNSGGTIQSTMPEIAAEREKNHLDIIKKQQEQIDKLIEVISQLSAK
jgi:predicted DNA-binding protein (UPF0251 family)